MKKSITLPIAAGTVRVTLDETKSKPKAINKVRFCVDASPINRLISGNVGVGVASAPSFVGAPLAADLDAAAKIWSRILASTRVTAPPSS